MKKFLILLILPFIFSCTEDRDLELNLRLEYGGQPFVFFSDLTYVDGTVFRITNMNFYLSDIRINTARGSEIISEVEFFDLGKSHLDLAGAQSGYSLLFGGIENEEIRSIDFNLGISAEQNSTVPSQYSNGHPLARSSEYWQDWNSYIQIKLEGFYDDNSDGIADKSFVLHLGSDIINRPISIDEIIDNDDVVELTLDIQDIFQDGTNIYDLLNTPRIHDLAQTPEMDFLANNLANAFGFDE